MVESEKLQKWKIPIEEGFVEIDNGNSVQLQNEKLERTIYLSILTAEKNGAPFDLPKEKETPPEIENENNLYHLKGTKISGNEALVVVISFSHKKDESWARSFFEGIRIAKKLEGNLGVYSTRQIVFDKEPVLHVSHDNEGDWQFLPYDTPNDKDAVFVHLGHFLEWDPSINEVMDLPVGWHAYREKVTDKWERKKIEKEKDGGWEQVKNYFPLPTIDPAKMKADIDFQVQNYPTLSPLKSFRGRLAIIFALLVNAVFLLYFKDRGLDSFAIFTAVLDGLLVLVWMGKKLAMYPLMFVAFIYPIMFSASIFPGSGSLMNLGLFLAIACGLWLMVEIYKTVQVENIRVVKEHGNSAK